ncbi:MAG: alpha-E domain-containing protein, partial [Methylococcaceae bacterium]|nr:alpha-E domain-containing protein [Methylococcaceae bacterium]
RDDMPRSLHACMNEVETALLDISGSSGREARRLAGELHANLHFGRIEQIFSQGLHEYLTAFLNATASLSREIREEYLSRRGYDAGLEQRQVA